MEIFSVKNVVYAIMIICGIMLVTYLTKDRIITLFRHNIVIYNDNGALSDADYARLHDQTEKALDTVNRVLGIKKNHSVKVKIVPSGYSSFFGDGIELPLESIRTHHAPVFGEISHLLSNHREERFFSEGLAVYFQEKYGEDRAFPDVPGKTLKQQLQEVQDRIIPIPDLAANVSLFSDNRDKEKQRMVYAEAGSFMLFLADRYGEDSLGKLNATRDLGYNAVFGKSLEQLAREWRDYYGL